ncbi:MAG TPA: redoxin family protein, partial [Candidatus Paceibacterota bacterium]|nr:redoxin family protein [Candidatus Paceibacterota bacterium]
FIKGFVYLLAYTLGLSLMLLLISLLGQKLVSKLENASNPHGTLKKTLAVLFILVGIFIISGLDKRIQALVVSNGVFDITRLETKLLEKTPAPNDSAKEDTSYDTKPVPEDLKYVLEAKKQAYPRYKEIRDPAGFVNSKPFKLEDYIGKKIILLDVMTYSCINCQRTFPYLRTWYETYEKEGLLIVGIHTPEFAFEKNIENVEAAMEQFGLTFPVVLDNNYSTWNAYGNNVWPRKYLIDIDGFIVYDHKGEGAYEEMEKKIQDLLKEKAQREGNRRAASEIKASDMKPAANYARSPETYFGSLRNTNFASGERGRVGEKDYMKPDDILLNQLYFSGRWDIEPEYARALRDSYVYFSYNASKIFAVASSEKGGQIEVYKDGEYVRTVDVRDAKLYTLIDDPKPSQSLLELRVESGVDLYTFTFG